MMPYLFAMLGPRKIDVLELPHLQREYLLVDARLRLLQKDHDPSHMVGKYINSP